MIRGQDIQTNPHANPQVCEQAVGGASPASLTAVSLHHSAIRSARAHAELVDAVEACAPPVLATYLAEAIRRAALPIRVKTGKDIHGYFISVQDGRIRTVPIRDIINLWNAGWPHLTGDHRDAKSAYLRLVATFSAPSSSLPVTPVARNSEAV